VRLLFLAALAAAAVVVLVLLMRPGSGSPADAGSVLLVGDSLNVGTEPYLHDELDGWDVSSDDRVGRPTSEGLDVLRELMPTAPSHVVVSLGTNDHVGSVEAFRGAVEEVVRLAAGRCVVWATLRRDGEAYEPFNAVLRDAAVRHETFALVDWSELVAADASLLADDGVHGSPEGYAARARAVAEAVRACRHEARLEPA
jgi:lysophospholipase L1-like esterase